MVAGASASILEVGVSTSVSYQHTITRIAMDEQAWSEILNDTQFSLQDGMF
jgi:hypothetical protein